MVVRDKAATYTSLFIITIGLLAVIAFVHTSHWPLSFKIMGYTMVLSVPLCIALGAYKAYRSIKHD